MTMHSVISSHRCTTKLLMYYNICGKWCRPLTSISNHKHIIRIAIPFHCLSICDRVYTQTDHRLAYSLQLHVLETAYRMIFSRRRSGCVLSSKVSTAINSIGEICWRRKLSNGQGSIRAESTCQASPPVSISILTT